MLSSTGASLRQIKFFALGFDAIQRDAMRYIAGDEAKPFVALLNEVVSKNKIWEVISGRGITEIFDTLGHTESTPAELTLALRPFCPY